MIGTVGTAVSVQALRIVPRVRALSMRLRDRASSVARGDEGQGTTEYAILVGVLVVIAIIAIAAFRGRIQELWSSIADAINGL